MLSLYNKVVQKAQQHNHRQLLVISGNAEWCYQQVKMLNDTLSDQNERTVYVSDNPQISENVVAIKQAKSLLGQEFSRLVYDAHCGLNCNAFASVAGTIKGGGVMIMLCPDLTQWPSLPDPESERMTASHQHSDNTPYFIKRFIGSVSSSYGINILSESQQSAVIDNHQAITTEKAFAQQQQHVVAQALHVLSGHRNRPLILTADRGRGKSAALGLSAKAMIEQNPGIAIAVTAPSPKSVEVLFKHATEQLNDEDSAQEASLQRPANIEFYAPDTLLRVKPKIDVLIVDEASAIPISLLIDITRSYSRVIFATTIHGYEGSGLGFSIKFKQYLRENNPGYKEVSISIPARWNDGDPLEAFCNQAFSLNSKLTIESESTSVETNNVQIFDVTARDLYLNDMLLSEVFSLLVSAHYQTSPDDLRSLLDHPAQRLSIAKAQGKVVGVVLGHMEYIESPELRQAIWDGERRVRGCLLPQLMAVQLNQPQVLAKRFMRIVRIATHPQFERQSVASQLLSAWKLTGDDTTDFLGSSFAADDGLIDFWKKAAFEPWHIGIKRDAASGLTSAVVLYATNEESKTQLRTLKANHLEQLRLRIPVFHKEVSNATLNTLFYNALPLHRYRLTSLELSLIKSFGNGKRQLDSVFGTLTSLFWHKLVSGDLLLASIERDVMFELLLKLEDSALTKDKLSINGDKAWLKLVRSASLKLIGQQHYIEV